MQADEVLGGREGGRNRDSTRVVLVYCAFWCTAQMREQDRDVFVLLHSLPLVPLQILRQRGSESARLKGGREVYKGEEAAWRRDRGRRERGTQGASRRERGREKGGER